MTFVKTKSLATLISLSFLIIGSTNPGQAMGSDILLTIPQPLIPEKRITANNPDMVPFWKVLWDDARTSVRREKYYDAVAKYSTILEYKPNFDEVRKEYISTLLYLKNFEDAEKQLNILFAHGVDAIESQILQGELFLYSNRFSKAVSAFEDMHQQQLSEDNFDRVQLGLALSLAAVDENEKALELFTELVINNPNNDFLIKKAALVAIKSDNFEQAQRIIKQIAHHENNDPELMEIKALLHERKKESEKAAVLWQKLVGMQPDNKAANRALARYYQKHGNQSMEIKHLERLFSQEQYSKDTLQRLIELMLITGRADRALEICDISSDTFSADHDIILLRNKAITTLAKNLLVIVENEGTKLLWDDLVEVTKYRTEVYLNIAELLRKRQNYNKLADVLLLISKEKPHNDPVWDELESLLQRQGRKEELKRLYGQRKIIKTIAR